MVQGPTKSAILSASVDSVRTQSVGEESKPKVGIPC